MLIRAQDGTIYHRDHITRIAIVHDPEVKVNPGDSMSDTSATGYYVQARVEGQEVRLTNRCTTEDEAVHVLDRIMAHREGNLDLLQSSLPERSRHSYGL